MTLNYLPSPERSQYPDMTVSYNSVKYDTLLPLISSDFIHIENDLKVKLNKFAFSNESKPILEFVRPMVQTPPLTPPPSRNESLKIDSITVATKIPLFDKKRGQLFKGIDKQPIILKLQNLNRNIPQAKKVSTTTPSTATSSQITKRRRHICKTCSMGFTTAGHLSRHNRIHTGEKNHTCPFDECDQKFSRHDNCIQHYRTHLKKDKKQ